MIFYPLVALIFNESSIIDSIRQLAIKYIFPIIKYLLQIQNIFLHFHMIPKIMLKIEHFCACNIEEKILVVVVKNSSFFSSEYSKYLENLEETFCLYFWLCVHHV